MSVILPISKPEKNLLRVKLLLIYPVKNGLCLKTHKSQLLTKTPLKWFKKLEKTKGYQIKWAK